MPQRQGSKGRQKSIRKAKGAKTSRGDQMAGAEPDPPAEDIQVGNTAGVEYPVPRLAWSLRPS
jgi:hypothetical protein